MKKRICLILLILLLLPLTANAEGIAYLDAQGASRTHTGTITSLQSASTGWTDGWYVVDSDVTITDRITVTGDVHLILANEKTLNAAKGICVSGANSLTIYAQSAKADEMGVLNANVSQSNSGAGIGSNQGDSTSCGTITINGGRIHAVGGQTYYGSAGIGGGRGGSIVINGGNITAKGGTGSYGAAAGIGAGGQSQHAGSITITGGTIHAEGGTNGAAGIGGGGHDGELDGPLSITGGWIVAKGNYRHGQTGQGQAVTIGGGASMQFSDLSQSTLVLIDATTNTGKVYGDVVLDHDAALPANATLTVPQGATLTIPQGVTLTIPQNATIVNHGVIYTDQPLSGVENVYHVNHTPVYKASGMQLSVSCANTSNLCSLSATLTLIPPEKTLTTDNRRETAELVGEDWPAAALVPVIEYEVWKDGAYVRLNAAPTAAGRYRVIARVADVSVQAEYEITAPVLDDTPPCAPPTGDSTPLLGLCVMLLLSAGAMPLAFRRCRR